MTGINNPFSQFNTPYAPMYNQNNTPAQNNILPKEQTTQSNKKQFNPEDLLIPVGTTAAGGVGGFAVAQFQAGDKFETLKQNASKLEKELTDQLNKSRDVVQLNKNINEAKKGIATAESNLAGYQKDLLKTQRKSEIDIINDLIKSANEMKKSNTTELNKYNALLKSYQEQHVKTPVDSFIKSETAKIQGCKNKTIAICTAVGLVVGLGIALINRYFKRDDK